MKKSDYLKHLKFQHSLAMEDQHIAKYAGIIDCPTHIMHNKTIFAETATPKINDFEFGEPDTIYYIPNSKNTSFKTMEDLLDYYNLPFEDKE